ncbi:MAG: S8 family serine peptidase [Ignavibacteria bacterium]|nr:S8 family serine peptidase [Ignavibacteria bacterium]
MKIFSLFAGVVLIVLISFSFNNTTTSENNLANYYQDNNYLEGDIIVMFKSDINAQDFVNNFTDIDLKVKEILVPDMNIYLFHYDVARSQPVDALMSVMRNDKVAIAQFNHYVTERVIPNDTRFAEQWDKHNTGQTGGTADADIDAPEAWETTAGGLTVFGDTIVVAIVDGGQQVAHPDLDTWTNWAEIPGNGIDDDNNGYIDDINGWNANLNNGTIPANQHGTHCAGIAGAKGNNNLGVAGVNMNVKTMPVVYGNSPTLEQSVVKAYGYVLKQRKIYNQTNGTQGAFIVSTNSSFGVDNGNPANYPLWCGFYDSLGAAGILNAGAGPNNNVNIDVVGDIPTTCPSPYMIAVTNTTNTDAKNSGAGYGAINMDLGAPGTNILSTVPTSSYGLLTGTSMATPQVAGAVGLLYAGASSIFINLARNDPDSAALLFKQYILASVDTIPSLAGITVSNGRLNVNRLLQKVKVTNVPVLNPFALQSPAAGTTLTSVPFGTTQYTITWDTSATGATYRFVFGNPTTTPRKISIPAGLNSLTISSGQLDNILAGLGVIPGQSLVGEWDVWSYRILPVNDSLKANNGPRAITLRRNLASLSNFNLISPPAGTTITTSTFNTSTVNINWSRSGDGTTYKFKFGSPTLSNIRLTLPSNNSGYDSLLSIGNNTLDGVLQGLGLNAGDSLVGQWAVWAYNGVDSVKSTQTNAVTFKRQAKGNVVILYDSTLAACRTARDSVVNNLNSMTETYDLFNRKGQTTGTTSISFRGYKKVILLGEGTSVVSNVVKDSIKAYLISGGTTSATKSKLIILAEDIGYQLDRTGSTYLDTTFFRTILGCQYIADRPGTTGNRGLVGVTINPNMADSTVGSFPDVLKKSSSAPSGQLFTLYKFRLFPDSLNAIGRIGTNYNISTMGVDVESLRPAFDSPSDSPVKRLLKGAMDFVDEIPTSVTPANSGMIPKTYSLSQNYPNPFNPTTKINFSIPKQGIVTLKIYDVLGKEVMTLVNETKAAGNYEVEFTGSSLASGAYFYRIESGEFTDIKRMILLK